MSPNVVPLKIIHLVRTQMYVYKYYVFVRTKGVCQHRCPYQGKRNNSFLESLAYILHEWSMVNFLDSGSEVLWNTLRPFVSLAVCLEFFSGTGGRNFLIFAWSKGVI